MIDDLCFSPELEWYAGDLYQTVTDQQKIQIRFMVRNYDTGMRGDVFCSGDFPQPHEFDYFSCRKVDGFGYQVIHSGLQRCRDD